MKQKSYHYDLAIPQELRLRLENFILLRGDGATRAAVVRRALKEFLDRSEKSNSSQHQAKATNDKPPQ